MTNDVKVKSVKAPKRTKIASLDRRKARAGWFFVLPFIIGFILIYLPMIYNSIRLSFHQIDLSTGTDVFVGWKNYSDALFDDKDFAETLVTGLKDLLFDIPAILIFSLFMAIMLNQKAAGRGAFRAIFFIPVILSTGIMDSLAAMDENYDNMDSAEGIDDGSGESAANQLVSSMDMQLLFANMKVGTGIVTWVTDAVNDIYNIVNRAGVQMLIFLAGLQSISPAIYESCKIDGATAWETFWKITFPMISPMILVNGIYTVIDSFSSQNNIVMNLIIDKFNAGDKAVSSAMGWIYFPIVALIVAVVALVMSAYVFYQRKND